MSLFCMGEAWLAFAFGDNQFDIVCWFEKLTAGEAESVDISLDMPEVELGEIDVVGHMEGQLQALQEDPEAFGDGIVGHIDNFQEKEQQLATAQEVIAEARSNPEVGSRAANGKREEPKFDDEDCPDLAPAVHIETTSSASRLWPLAIGYMQFNAFALAIAVFYTVSFADADYSTSAWVSISVHLLWPCSLLYIDELGLMAAVRLSHSLSHFYEHYLQYAR